MVSPFVGLKDKIHELKIDDIVIKVQPKVKEAQLFILMKEEMTDKDTQRMSSIMQDIIVRANPEDDPEDIEAFIALHYGTLMEELTILFGFSTREQMDKIKAKIQEKVKKKLE